MKKLLVVFAHLLASLFSQPAAHAATSVLLAPIPQFYATDTAGRPLASGCVFTYISGTTTPLATYTDSAGTVQNPNPVILSVAGTANIWIQAGQAYTFRVKSTGGSMCGSGTTRYTVNGIGGGSSQVSTNVSSSATPQFTAIAQNQLFLFTLTGNTVALPLVVNNVQPPSLISFQIKQDATGNWTFAWPANTIGGAQVRALPGSTTSQTFLWNGSVATAVGPGVYEDGTMVSPADFIAKGQLFGTNLFLSGNGNVTGNFAVNGSLTKGGQDVVHTGTNFDGSPICGVGTQEVVNCGYPLVQKDFVTAVYSNATTTFSNVPGMSFTVAANQLYAMTCQLTFLSSAATAGPKFRFTAPAGAQVSLNMISAVDPTTGAFDSDTSSGGTTTVINPGVVATGIAQPVTVTAAVQMSSTGGVVGLMAAANGAGQLDIANPSFCQFQ